jgi:hypothetical protein
MKTVATEMTATDRRYGYAIGVDGLVSLSDASALLGGVSRSTLDRLALAGSIRKARVGGKVCYCRRSLSEYIRTTEV